MIKEIMTSEGVFAKQIFDKRVQIQKFAPMENIQSVTKDNFLTRTIYYNYVGSYATDFTRIIGSTMYQNKLCYVCCSSNLIFTEYKGGSLASAGEPLFLLIEPQYLKFIGGVNKALRTTIHRLLDHFRNEVVA